MIGSINLLLVDEPAWTRRTTRELERVDDRFAVVTEQSPSEGRARIAEEHIDCVVSAYDLPERNGVSFLRSVRETYPDLPFVIVTEVGSEEIASEAISAGVSDYYIRGLDVSLYSVLAHRLKTLVEGHRATRIIDAAQANWEGTSGRSGDVYYMFTGDWDELLYINSAYERVWGGSVEDLEADPLAFLDGIHPADREVALGSMERLSDGQSTDVEYRIRPPEGEQRWVRGVSQPVVDESGDVVRVMGSVRDVTGIKEKERRFRAVFDDSFDAMVIANDDGEYVQVNDAACELFGLEEAALLGRNVTEFAAPEFDVAGAWERFQTSAGERGRFPLRRPDGTVRTVEYAATRDIVPGNHLSILRDVTDRERQRAALEESRAQYETLVEDVLDTSSVGTFILDENFEVVWVNSAVEEYFGIERDAVLGRNKEALIRRRLKHRFARPDRFVEKVTRTYRDNTYTQEFECRIREGDSDRWRWLRHWSRPIESGLYEGGRIEHYTDVTDLKERDRQLEVLARVLRHNLYNKMTVVLGFAETIAGDADGQARGHAERISAAANDLLELTDQQRRVVDLVSHDSELQSVDLANGVRQSVEQLRAEFPDAAISTDLPAEAEVRAVADIAQAVAELVENAIVHSHAAAEVDVTVSGSSGHVVVSVVDHNHPIPDLEKSVLRGEREIDQLSHSKGLGLWLVNWLVVRSNGTITFDYGTRGNVVKLILPAART